MYNNKLREDIFDALLTSAFTECMEEEFAELPSDEELARMYPISKKSLRKAKRRAKAIEYGAPMPIVYLRRACVVVLVLASLSFGVLAMDDNVRAAIKDSFVEWYDKYVKINFAAGDDDEVRTSESTEVDSVENKDINSLQIGYIPEGFVLERQSEYQNTKNYKYKSQNGYVSISICSSDSTNQIVADIEVSEYEKTSINDNNAYILYNNSRSYGTLITGNRIYSIRIVGNLEKSELIKIAENIK